jgi:hypothetical protein
MLACQASTRAHLAARASTDPIPYGTANKPSTQSEMTHTKPRSRTSVLRTSGMWCWPSPRRMFPRAGGVLVCAGDGGVHADVPGDQPGGVRAGLQRGDDLRPDTGALPASEQGVDRLPGAVAVGTSRHGAPTRTRQRMPSMSCRLVHRDGRPGFFGAGSSG